MHLPEVRKKTQVSSTSHFSSFLASGYLKLLAEEPSLMNVKLYCCPFVHVNNIFFFRILYNYEIL